MLCNDSKVPKVHPLDNVSDAALKAQVREQKDAEIKVIFVHCYF